MDFHQAVKEIKNGKVAPLYLFSGPEDYLKEELLGEIMLFLDQKGRSFDLERKDGIRLSMAELLENVQQRTIVAAGKIYWISNSPYFTPPPQKAASAKGGKGAGIPRLSDEEEKKLLARAISKKNDLDYLLIFTVEKADRRKKIVKAIEKEGAMVEFPSLKGASLSRWIRNELLLRDKLAEEDALIELVERAGDDLRFLKNELEKIITYMGREKTITRRLVGLLVAESREDSIFDLVEAVGRRDIREASSRLAKILQQNEHPLKIFAMITRQFRLLYQIGPMQQRKLSRREIASALKIQPFLVGELLKQAEKYNEALLTKFFLLLKETDREIKTGKREGAEALEQLLLKLCLLS